MARIRPKTPTTGMNHRCQAARRRRLGCCGRLHHDVYPRRWCGCGLQRRCGLRSRRRRRFRRGRRYSRMHGCRRGSGRGRWADPQRGVPSMAPSSRSMSLMTPEDMHSPSTSGPSLPSPSTNVSSIRVLVPRASSARVPFTSVLVMRHSSSLSVSGRGHPVGASLPRNRLLHRIACSDVAVLPTSLMGTPWNTPRLKSACSLASTPPLPPCFTLGITPDFPFGN